MRSGALRARFIPSAIVCLAGCLILASAASATSVDIRFTATTGSGSVGSNEIDAASGDELTAVVRLTAGTGGVSSYGISLKFDEDLVNELNILSATELLPPQFAFNLNAGCNSTQESTGAQEGNVLGCEAATLSNGLTSAESADIFEVVFQVTGNVATDGADMQTGLFSTGFDGVFDNNGVGLSPTFGSASVNIIPEPSSAILLGLGLIGLAVTGRKPQR